MNKNPPFRFSPADAINECDNSAVETVMKFNVAQLKHLYTELYPSQGLLAQDKIGSSTSSSSGNAVNGDVDNGSSGASDSHNGKGRILLSVSLLTALKGLDVLATSRYRVQLNTFLTEKKKFSRNSGDLYEVRVTRNITNKKTVKNLMIVTRKIFYCVTVVSLRGAV